MDIRELRYIMEVAKTQNITKAANNLYISQPALSKSLKKVEAELGITLFFRDGNTIFPTDGGKLVLKWGKSITKDFSTLQEELQDLKSMKSGKVTLGIPPMISAIDFPNIILRFRQSFPGISLHIREAGARNLENAVLDGTVDIAISMRPVTADGLSELPLISDQIVCVTTTDHPFARMQTITLQELSTVSFNTFPEGYAVHQQIICKFVEAGLSPAIENTSLMVDFLLQMSRLCGIPSILPAPCVSYFNNRGLVMIPFDPPLSWELCIVYKRNVYMSDSIKALIASIQRGIEPPLPMC